MPNCGPDIATPQTLGHLSQTIPYRQRVGNVRLEKSEVDDLLLAERCA
jgi:hypothetical protein